MSWEKKFLESFPCYKMGLGRGRRSKKLFTRTRARRTTSQTEDYNDNYNFYLAAEDYSAEPGKYYNQVQEPEWSPRRQTTA